MALPTLEREGARIGGVLTDRCAVTCRTDSAGTHLHLTLFTDSARSIEAQGITYTAGALNAGNNYQGTAYAEGLRQSKKYWWRIDASDNAARGAGNVAEGTEPLSANSFKTISTDITHWKIGLTGCYYGYPQINNATKATTASTIVKNILNQNLDAFFHIGDVYYADIGADTGSTPYAQGYWRDQTRNIDDGDLTAFRSNFITTIDGNQPAATDPDPKSLMHLMAETPGYYMWDDHDRCYNDCGDIVNDAGVGDQNKVTRGHQVGHECYMDLNKELVDQESDRDFVTDAQGENVNPEEYYYIDKPPVRFIVPDLRSWRDAKQDADTSSKTMLGADQKTWLKARIDDNPQKYLVLVMSINLDGDHGVWLESAPHDGWKTYSYERDEILDYVWDNANPTRTAIVSMDTHNGAIMRYDKHGTRQPIYECSASNGIWIPSAHGYITGVAEESKRTGETICASGNGASLQLMRVQENNMTVVEADSQSMRVKMVETNPYKVVWSRVYR